MKRLYALCVMLIALATAGPALADGGQSSDRSAGTVQLGSGNASPTASADAPTNIDATVCIASTCSNQAGAQEGGASATTNGGSGSGSSSGSSQTGGQTTGQSAGTAQVGSANAEPAVAASAPVNASAPVCVLSTCGSTAGGETGGGGTGAVTGGGTTDGGATGGEPIARPLPPETEPANPAGPAGNPPETPALTSSPGGASEPAPAGNGVLGSGAGNQPNGGAGASPTPSVAAKGQLPYAGLPLPAALVIGLALLLGGSTAWGVARRSEWRAA